MRRLPASHWFIYRKLKLRKSRKYCNNKISHCELHKSMHNTETKALIQKEQGYHFALRRNGVPVTCHWEINLDLIM